jgi:hypothetical protein
MVDWWIAGLGSLSSQPGGPKEPAGILKTYLFTNVLFSFADLPESQQSQTRSKFREEGTHQSKNVNVGAFPLVKNSHEPGS